MTSYPVGNKTSLSRKPCIADKNCYGTLSGNHGRSFILRHKNFSPHSTFRNSEILVILYLSRSSPSLPAWQQFRRVSCCEVVQSPYPYGIFSFTLKLIPHCSSASPHHNDFSIGGLPLPDHHTFWPIFSGIPIPFATATYGAVEHHLDELVRISLSTGVTPAVQNASAIHSNIRYVLVRLTYRNSEILITLTQSSALSAHYVVYQRCDNY